MSVFICTEGGAMRSDHKWSPETPVSARWELARLKQITVNGF